MTTDILGAQDISELIDDYETLMSLKDELAEKTKECNAMIVDVRDRLSAAMLEAEIPRMDRGGYAYSLSPRTRYSKKGGNDDEFFDFMRQEGLGDLIKETVNAQTLQGAMSNVAEENGGVLPEHYADYITTFEFMDISRRKVAKKI